MSGGHWRLWLLIRINQAAVAAVFSVLSPVPSCVADGWENTDQTVDLFAV